ncbi:hypothetical protein R1flu_005630 [Riccia fluitans]|uniref:Uncharacterized protein n=1 Tax=Riccia fluitans TaxID=41844 RepID=A0ABD1YTQ3_9MARC
MRNTYYEADQEEGNFLGAQGMGGGKMQGTKKVHFEGHPSSVVDLEKAGVYKDEAPALRGYINTHVLEDREPTSQPKPVIVPEKFIVTALVACFVLMEVYFVGVSFRDWIDNKKHGNSTSLLLQNEQVEFFVPQALEVYKAGVDCDGQDEIDDDVEPYEDFEGGLSYMATTEILRQLAAQLFPRKRNAVESILFEKGVEDPEDVEVRESTTGHP